MGRTFAAKRNWRRIRLGLAAAVLAELMIAIALEPFAHGQGPALMTINDTVYRAGGTIASGTVLISWPSFETAEGDAAAAGNQSAITGSLTLLGSPTAPNQAADRQDVDGEPSAKADLVNGIVPFAELRTGSAGSNTCLTGNSTWGACGGGAPAGINYATTALSWSQRLSAALTGGQSSTVTLTPCPTGIDTTSGIGYQVYLSGGGNSEAATVTSGSCSSGASSGTIILTPYFSYPAGSTVGSATSGIQETLNAACGTNPNHSQNGYCNVTLPATGTGYKYNQFVAHGTIHLFANQASLSGNGVVLLCEGRGPCLQVGDLKNSNDYVDEIVSGINFQPPLNLASNPSFAGAAITQTQRTSQVVTVTTATSHGFRRGDMVTQLFTDNSAYWGDAVITAVPSSTTYQYSHVGRDIPAQTTPGVVALAYDAILDNGWNTHFVDITQSLGSVGAFNNFFDIWDDENMLIEKFNNNGSALNGNINWTGSFFFSAGNQGTQQIAPVISVRDSNLTANGSNCATLYNSNGLYVENTVCQASGPWQFYSANTTGNYQGAYLKNIYSESTVNANPLSPARSPFPGLGIAGLIAGTTSPVADVSVLGGSLAGAFPSGGSGPVAYSYFIVAHDCVGGSWSGATCSSGNTRVTSPMQVYNYNSTGRDTIKVRWPRLANGTDGITYDIVRATTPVSVGSVFPSAGNCNGGSALACGSVAVGLTQAVACGNSLVCSYADGGGAVTSSYSPAQGNYYGNFLFWPGGLVTVTNAVVVDREQAPLVAVGLNGNPAQIATSCQVTYGVASPGGYTTCAASNNNVTNQTATLMTDGFYTGGGMSQSKGRLNFSMSPNAVLNPHHIITLIDSNPSLTRSTAGFRPPASVTDTWIGTDVPRAGVAVAQGQLAMGAPKYIDFYINNVGDNTNFLERLSSALKTFNVPVQFNSNVTVSGNLNLPQGSGYVPGPGGIGLDTAAGMLVVNVGGTIYRLAFTRSNIRGQAAVDAAVVHLAGAETITGPKTFSNDVTLGNLNVAGNIKQTGSSATQWSGKKWTGTTATVPTGMDFSLGIGSDSTLRCQLASGGSCMPTGGAVASAFGRTGAVVAASGDYAVAQVTGAAPLASPVFTGTPLAPTATAGDNSAKWATTAYVKSEVYLTWTCPVAGSTSISQNCNWTLPANITVTGFDFAANTAPVGCTAYPVMQVWDGTSGAEVGSYSIPLASGENFYRQVAGNANVGTTHQLRIKVTTAAAGCTTNAGGMVATVTYQMQN